MWRGKRFDDRGSGRDIEPAMKTFFNTASIRILATLLATTFLIGGCQTAPKKVFVSADIPVGIGTVYEAYQNNPGGDTVKINIGVQGPWDFSAGPSAVVVKSQIIKVDKSADHNAFPEATYAEKIFASDFTGGAVAYNFASLNESSLQSYGQSVAPKGKESVFKRFTKSERLLVFPLRVGDKWTDTMKIEGETGNGYGVAKEVVARGSVKVPAGLFFDCFMVKITKTTTGIDGSKIRSLIYTWWAPGTGLVAAAGSNPGEDKAYFNQAAYLFRLKSYKIAGK
jgi:hypothetical protein